MAGIASGSNVQVSYVAETVQGTTPATPVFQIIPVSTESVLMSRDTLESEALRADRQISDIINGNKQVGGDISGELRYGAFDDWIEAALGGTWATDTPVVGTDEVEAGVIRRFFSIERLHADNGDYFRNVGCEMAGFTMDRSANALTTLSFNILGLAQDSDTAILPGATYTPAVTTSPMDGFSGTFEINGLTDACITTATMTLDNGNEALFCLGSDTALDQAQGKSRITGSVSIYFEDLSAYTLFNAGTYFSMDIQVIDGALNQYVINLPQVKYTSADTSVPDSNPLIFTYDFAATAETGTSSNISIQRTPI